MKAFYSALTLLFLFGASLASPLDLAADSPERTLVCCPTTKSNDLAMFSDVPVKADVAKP
ncbi:hypothetical protein N7491_010013 [Penicillium cf. griseofulvum]|uniref:Uncharacterized protein n=1 Tax=Penicillium cf. griseofulvum TaxID=2972120 RepID=A0A9W9MZ43_9EURO|nr:hypothetical protein N7472_000345 [Penicillium cf. griseofulvum]KAJ5421568.1 hypothetical protein N7491_010013 [Penicillium cf. griseofulvum]KAJ5424802.1 hypothetical protein N7445_010775 [Penicillium cf. griseofulvum]